MLAGVGNGAAHDKARVRRPDGVRVELGAESHRRIKNWVLRLLPRIVSVYGDCDVGENRAARPQRLAHVPEANSRVPPFTPASQPSEYL